MAILVTIRSLLVIEGTFLWPLTVWHFETAVLWRHWHHTVIHECPFQPRGLPYSGSDWASYHQCGEWGGDQWKLDQPRYLQAVQRADTASRTGQPAHVSQNVQWRQLCANYQGDNDVNDLWHFESQTFFQKVMPQCAHYHVVLQHYPSVISNCWTYIQLHAASQDMAQIAHVCQHADQLSLCNHPQRALWSC